ncbi:uncharacterized protein LOC119770393 [Culex quinquefasciatus]|uniref:uncharacterized protein LOC119770393 n=1 Tax=Culex quinquefasciatus TaxID=7176 RepID=UPI0018E297F8|nr:uncharacterized protein LOC119770393 [Culex quinquefasciatus]
MVRPPGHGHQGGSSADGCQRRMISRGPIAAPTTVALYPDSASANGSAVVRIRTNSQASELSPLGNSRFPQQQKKRSSAWSPQWPKTMPATICWPSCSTRTSKARSCAA